MRDVFGIHLRGLGIPSTLTKRPPNTMDTSITAGPIARAADVEGAAAPTVIPRAWAAKLSATSMPRKLANLTGEGANPVQGYTTAPKSMGNKDPTGSSAANFYAKYEITGYADLPLSL